MRGKLFGPWSVPQWLLLLHDSGFYHHCHDNDDCHDDDDHDDDDCHDDDDHDDDGVDDDHDDDDDNPILQYEGSLCDDSNFAYHVAFSSIFRSTFSPPIILVIIYAYS